MVLVRCSKCGHEWQQPTVNIQECDWCGNTDNEVLETNCYGNVDLFAVARTISRNLNGSR